MAARRRPQRSRSERHECRNVTGGTPWVGAAWRSAWWLWEARASAPRISSSMRLAELAAVDRCTVQFIRTWCSLVPASLRACGSRVLYGFTRNQLRIRCEFGAEGPVQRAPVQRAHRPPRAPNGLAAARAAYTVQILGSRRRERSSSLPWWAWYAETPDTGIECAPVASP